MKKTYNIKKALAGLSTTQTHARWGFAVVTEALAIGLAVSSLFLPWWSMLDSTSLTKTDVYLYVVSTYHVDSTWMFFKVGFSNQRSLPTQATAPAVISIGLMVLASFLAIRSLILLITERRRTLATLLSPIFTVSSLVMFLSVSIEFVPRAILKESGYYIGLFGSLNNAAISWGPGAAIYLALYSAFLNISSYLLDRERL